MANCYAESRLCWVFILSDAKSAFTMSVIMLNVVKLSVFMLRVVAPCKLLQDQSQALKTKLYENKFWS